MPVPLPAPPAAVRSSAGAPAGLVTLSRLTLTPRRPKAGRTLASTVVVRKRGVLMRQGHVFCSGRFEGRRLKVLSRRLVAGKANCSWRLPAATRGKLVSAAVIVQQGRVRVVASFRARIT